MGLKHPDIPKLSTCTHSLSSLREETNSKERERKKTGNEIPPPLLIKPQSSEYV